MSGQLVKSVALQVNELITASLEEMNKMNHIRLLLQTLYKYLMQLTHDMNQGQNKLACRAMAKFLSMQLGSALASMKVLYAKNLLF
jgi:hypothetical protein